MEYVLFFGGIVLIGFAYLIYKAFKLSMIPQKGQYLKTALIINSVGVMFMSVSAGAFFVVTHLVR